MNPTAFFRRLHVAVVLSVHVLSRNSHELLTECLQRMGPPCWLETLPFLLFSVPLSNHYSDGAYLAHHKRLLWEGGSFSSLVLMWTLGKDPICHFYPSHSCIWLVSLSHASCGIWVLATGRLVFLPTYCFLGCAPLRFPFLCSLEFCDDSFGLTRPLIFTPNLFPACPVSLADAACSFL